MTSSRTGPSCPGDRHGSQGTCLALATRALDPPVTCRAARLTAVCGSKSCPSVPCLPALGGGVIPWACSGHTGSAPGSGHQDPEGAGCPAQLHPLTSGHSLRRGGWSGLLPPRLIWPSRPLSGTPAPRGLSPARPAFPHAKAEANLGLNWTMSGYLGYLMEGPAGPRGLALWLCLRKGNPRGLWAGTDPLALSLNPDEEGRLLGRSPGSSRFRPSPAGSSGPVTFPWATLETQERGPPGALMGNSGASRWHLEGRAPSGAAPSRGDESAWALRLGLPWIPRPEPQGLSKSLEPRVLGGRPRTPPQHCLHPSQSPSPQLTTRPSVPVTLLALCTPSKPSPRLPLQSPPTPRSSGRPSLA